MRKLLITINTFCENFLLYFYKKIEENKKYNNKIIFDNKFSHNKDKLLIYSMYFNNNINKYIYNNIKYFLSNGYDVLLIISLDCKNKIQGIINSQDLTGLRVVYRENYGKDFGSFKDAIEILSNRLKDLRVVILQNDSLIGPLYDSNFINKIELMPHDVIGITESLDYKYHIQSSFIVIKSPLAIQILQNFMREYPVYQFRSFIVKYGEIELSQYFIKGGLNIGVYAPLLKLIEIKTNSRIINI